MSRLFPHNLLLRAALLGAFFAGGVLTAIALWLATH